MGYPGHSHSMPRPILSELHLLEGGSIAVVDLRHLQFHIKTHLAGSEAECTQQTHNRMPREERLCCVGNQHVPSSGSKRFERMDLVPNTKVLLFCDVELTALHITTYHYIFEHIYRTYLNLCNWFMIMQMTLFWHNLQLFDPKLPGLLLLAMAAFLSHIFKGSSLWDSLSHREKTCLDVWAESFWGTTCLRLSLCANSRYPHHVGLCAVVMAKYP